MRGSGRDQLLAVSLALGLLVCGGGDPVARPNVLLILVDDLNTHLGAWGDRLADTPHIDRLAASGVRFERAYAQYPLCNPSRASMLSGRYPTATGILDNRRPLRVAMPDGVTLPETFRHHGYVTARAGKIFHGGLDDEQSWDEGGEPVKRQVRRGRREIAAYVRRSDRWGPVEGDAADWEVDVETAERALELLERHRDQHFFIAVGFEGPHTPLVAPRRYFEVHEGQDVPLPADFAPRARAARGAPRGVLGANRDLFVRRRASPEQAREAVRAYHAVTSFVDAQVGRVLGALDALGLRERTAVVFASDHGFHLGEKGKWSKHRSLYDPALRVPLVIAAPGHPPGVSRRTVELLDLYPTLLELAGLTAPEGLEGQSLVPLLVDPDAPWKNPARSFSRNPIGLGRSVRTERYRYTEWRNGRAGTELYDYANDPHETRNRARDPAYRDTVGKLKQLLQR